MVIIALLVFAVCLAAELPVAIGLTAAGTVGLILHGDVSQTAATLASAAFQNTSTYTLVVIPMFILMGVLVANAGVLTDLFNLAARITRKLPGGLGVATVMSAAGFSAVTGSSAAAVATLGKICVTEMKRHGYALRFAAGIVAASGTLGILIPPSIVLVIYGVLTNESVAQLLLAAVIPGIITAIAYVITIVLVATIGHGVGGNPDKKGAGEVHDDLKAPAPGSGAVATADGGPRGADMTLMTGTGTIDPPDALDPAEVAAVEAALVGGPIPRAQRLRELEAVFYIGVVFVIVLGGIYGGIFTETEAGAFGALAALFILFARSGRTELGLWKSLTSALKETSAVTSMLFALLIGGGIFTLFLVTARVPNDLTTWILELGLSKYMVLLIILLVLLVLGALLDGVSILLLTMPLTYPVITDLGFSGLWYGIIAVKMVEIGLLTPPFGLNVYLVAGVTRAKVEDVFRGVVPFIIAEFCVVALLVAFPDLVTWLPELAKD